MVDSGNSVSSEHPTTGKRQSSTEQFVFHGNGSDYFRIWIVNLLFSILTLGIYSAWAKVRTKRYFYGNTELAGDRFEYLADPIAILKGRLIGVALLAAYTVAGFISFQVSIAAFLALTLLLPFIFVQALRFNAINSAWRGIRFGFDGRVAPAYLTYLLFPVIGVLTLGLALPWALYRINRFQIDNHRFGATASHATAGPGGFYGIVLVSLAAFISLFFVSMLAFGIYMMASFSPEFFESFATEVENSDGDVVAVPEMSSLIIVSVLIYFVFLLLFFVAGLLYEALRFRLVFNNIELADNKLRNSLSAGGYYWILLSNMLLTIVTLGIFTPWARVRRARYALSRMWLTTANLESFAAAEADQVSARGDEVGEAFDLGIGI